MRYSTKRLLLQSDKAIKGFVYGYFAFSVLAYVISEITGEDEGKIFAGLYGSFDYGYTIGHGVKYYYSMMTQEDYDYYEAYLEEYKGKGMIGPFVKGILDYLNKLDDLVLGSATKTASVPVPPTDVPEKALVPVQSLPLLFHLKTVYFLYKVILFMVKPLKL